MKLRPRIAFISCLVALTSVGATGGLLIRQSRHFAQEQLLRQQTLLVQNRGFALGDSIDLAAHELSRLSHMAEVDLTDNDVRPEATLLAHAHRNSTLFNIGLQILDATGRCIWSEPTSTECTGRSYAGARWFVQGRRASGPVVSGDKSEPTVINLVVPLGGRPGSADGVLRGIIDLRSDRIISPALTSELPRGTEVALVGPSGDLIFPARIEVTEGWRTAILAAPLQSAGSFLSDDHGERFLYAHAPVARAGWGLIFRWRYAALDVGLERQLRLLLYVLGLGGLLAVVLGFASSTFLTRPIEELLREVRAMVAARRDGHALTGTEPTPAAGAAAQAAARTDELGDLVRAFAELRDRLSASDALHREDLEQIRSLANSLEDRVRSRTAELESAQRSLVAQERLAAMGRAAAAISHELKNSLNALGMGFELMAAEAKKMPSLTRINAQVRDEVNRLRTMSDELLVFARSPQIRTAPVDLAALVRRTVALCSEQAAAAAVELIDAAPGAGPLVVSCDDQRVQSILVNLLQNAIEAIAWAAPPAPRREVRIAAQAHEPEPAGQPMACIVVDDSGPGLAAGSGEHLFEPFFTTKRNGTGLGLATAQRYAAAHGGRIEVARSPLGGARFTVWLPLRAARGTAEAA